LCEIGVQTVHLGGQDVCPGITSKDEKVAESRTHFEQSRAGKSLMGAVGEVPEGLRGLSSTRRDQPIAEPTTGHELRVHPLAIKAIEPLATEPGIRVHQSTTAADDIRHRLSPSRPARKRSGIVGVAEIACD